MVQSSEIQGSAYPPAWKTASLIEKETELNFEPRTLNLEPYNLVNAKEKT